MIKAYFHRHNWHAQSWSYVDFVNSPKKDRRVISGSEAILLDAAMQDSASDGLWLRGPDHRYTRRLRSSTALSLAAIARGE